MSHQFYKPAKSRLQRSELAVPGSSPKMFEKALNSIADYILGLKVTNLQYLDLKLLQIFDTL